MRPISHHVENQLTAVQPLPASSRLQRVASARPLAKFRRTTHDEWDFDCRVVLRHGPSSSRRAVGEPATMHEKEAFAWGVKRRESLGARRLLHFAWSWIFSSQARGARLTLQQGPALACAALFFGALSQPAASCTYKPKHKLRQPVQPTMITTNPSHAGTRLHAAINCHLPAPQIWALLYPATLVTVQHENGWVKLSIRTILRPMHDFMLILSSRCFIAVPPISRRSRRSRRTCPLVPSSMGSMELWTSASCCARFSELSRSCDPRLLVTRPSALTKVLHIEFVENNRGGSLWPRKNSS